MTEAIFDCRPNLLVHNLGASLRFYEEVLGFHIGWHWSGWQDRFFQGDERAEPGEPGTALVGRDRAQILVTQFTQRPEAHPTWLQFDVHTAAQVDDLYREWTANGATVDEPPVLRAWGMYEMRLRDPDGNLLRVSSPPPNS